MREHILFTVPVLERTRENLKAHVLESVKQLLTINLNREDLTWSNIKSHEGITLMLATLSSWFQVAVEIVTSKFQA